MSSSNIMSSTTSSSSSTSCKGYEMNFNQDFTSISVLSHNGFRLYSINASDKIDEIFAKENNEQIRIVERLFNSSLVVLVTHQKPNCLKMLHFKKKQDICNCVYPSDILCVRMNRYRLVVCLAESIHIHDIRDMKILHSIENIAPNELGLCSLSLNSHLAFPICTTSGELRIFNANKLKTGLTIKAHDTALSAMAFSPSGTLLATASERGTVIRVFCVKNGQKVQEFRRGVKRCVRIASLVFSTTGDFLCASSNTETVHIFRIDSKAVETAERKATIEDVKKTSTAPSSGSSVSAAANGATASTNGTATSSSSSNTNATTPAASNANTENSSTTPSNQQQPASTTTTTTTSNGSASSTSNSWSMSGYLSKAMSSYLLPSQIGDVLSQDRAFATAVLGQPGLKHVCGLAKIQKELRLLLACEDGFLYIHDFNSEKGGPCKLLHVHDLRYTLEGVIELNLSDSMDKISLSGNMPSTPTTNPSSGFSVDAKDPSPNSKDSSSSSPHSKSSSLSSVSVIIENPDPSSDNSYASILRGSEQGLNTLTDSAKFRKLCDAIDTPTKLYDERQFPPVAIAAKD
ncbi:WD repeat domain phosphoinositide-interacting protein 1 [Stomoxys calcitrans]|uniref:WD repeat domain phosphoinositide-interacting protein 2 n=1 Tax=Stomoxys calcitrans TaxID=35570 RepID=A0A1I8NR36_STOCA|nr:WD repeat domain phosphoinositide-interacting protein 1 [Stomoxys calcitrans]